MHRKESARRTLWVAFWVCAVCSALVTTTAVSLEKVQQANRFADRQRNILAAAGLLDPGKPLAAQSERLTTRMVDLRSGDFAEGIDPAAYDQRRAAKDRARSVALGPERDLAGIKRRAHHAPVYLVCGAGGALQTVVLPVHGAGLWSTLYGFLALAADARTVVGLTFFEHAETPGLGGEVDNPRWKASWIGKRVYDDGGRPAIRLVKRPAPPGDAAALHQVDALSGATLTTRGVEGLLHFWLGEDGFGPFLANLRALEPCP